MRNSKKRDRKFQEEGLKAQVEERIQKILSSVFTPHNGHFPDEWGPAEIGDWDSMNHLCLAAAISSEFELELGFEEMLEIKKVGDIKIILERHNIR
jgi:acyl carrier protein